MVLIAIGTVAAFWPAGSGRAGEPEPPLWVAPSPENESVILRLPDDSLRLFYVHHPEGNEIDSRESRDGGRTWGAERTEFKLPGVAYYAVQATLDADGEIQMVFHIKGSGAHGWKGHRYDVWHTRTVAGRSQWEKSTPLLEGYVGSLRGFTTLRSGRLLVSFSLAVSERETAVAGQPDFGWNDVTALFSDDKGATWHPTADRLKVLQIPDRGVTRYGGIEPHVREMLDGGVWMLVRTKNGHLYEAWSGDHGQSWSWPAVSRFISSDSPATTVRLKDNRLVLFFNSCQRWDDLSTYAVGGREVLHAAISQDDGRTWQGFREVLCDFSAQLKGDRGTAYPSATENAEGRIVLASGQGEGHRAIELIDPAWLAADHASEDFERGAEAWHGPGGTPPATVEEPGRGKVLAVGDGGAVWNFPMGDHGRLSFFVKPAAHWQGVTIALTDHFSVVGDSQAQEHAVFAFPPVASGSASLPAGLWEKVTIEWSPTEARLFLGDRQVASSPALRAAPFGVNYLRLIGPPRQTEGAGFLLDDVAVSVAR